MCHVITSVHTSSSVLLWVPIVGDTSALLCDDDIGDTHASLEWTALSSSSTSTSASSSTARWRPPARRTLFPGAARDALPPALRDEVRHDSVACQDRAAAERLSRREPPAALPLRDQFECDLCDPAAEVVRHDVSCQDRAAAERLRRREPAGAASRWRSLPHWRTTPPGGGVRRTRSTGTARASS